jgi:hypothetical protein
MKTSDLFSAFDEVQSGKTNSATGLPGADEKLINAKKAYLEMIGESPEPLQEKKEVIKEDKQASTTNKITAALQVIKETADNYENAEEAFQKIEKIINACK